MSNPKIIIIIGLPCSGKSFLSKKMIDYEVHDDFISNFYDGSVIESLIAGKKVCLLDPRLCVFKIFKEYFEKIECCVDKSQILLILFDNNPDQCLINLRNRLDNRKGIENAIKKFSLVYNLDNYKSFNYQIVNVYDPMAN